MLVLGGLPSQREVLHKQTHGDTGQVRNVMWLGKHRIVILLQLPHCIVLLQLGVHQRIDEVRKMWVFKRENAKGRAVPNPGRHVLRRIWDRRYFQ